MIQIFVKRHFSKTLAASAKKSKKPKPPCGPKKAKQAPKPCKPVVEPCKRMKIPSDVCKKFAKQQQGGTGGGSGGGAGLWKFISCGICLPLVIAFSLARFLSEEEPRARPPFHRYDYMRIRTSKFPWGDGNHTLFHNPCYNALPEGYEDDKCEEELLNEILKKSAEEEATKMP